MTKLISIIRAWLKYNFWLKLFALGIAVGVWFFASRGVYIRSSREVPVSLILAPEMTAWSITPSSVRVILDYPQERGGIRKTEKEVIEVVHDLSDATTPGKFVFAVTSRDVRVPSRVRVVSIEPSRISAEVDRLVEKVLPVKVVYRGKPRPGYRIVGETVNPTEVMVPGPEGLLKGMKAIETEPLMVMERSDSFYGHVELKPVTPLTGKKLEPVNVYVVIAEELRERELPEIPVTVLKEPGQTAEIVLDPSVVTLLLRGQEKDLDGITPGDVRAYVEIIDLETGSYELPLKTKLPKSIRLERADPAVIKVILGQGQPRLIEPGL